MNEALEIVGLGDWYALWEPDLDLPNKGKCYSDDMSIIICDSDPEDSMETLVHEILELKLNPVLGDHKKIINQLMSLIQDFLYYKKELVIRDLTPFVLRSIGEKMRENGEEGKSA